MVTDKRIIKTRTRIKEAFMQLMLKNDMTRITISDIADKAKINRSTFYLHYSDASGVMKDIEDEIEKQIISCIESFDISDINLSTYSLFTNLTDALNEKPMLKSYILDSTSSQFIILRLKSIFADIAKEALTESFPNLDKEKIEYPITFASSGIIDCYVKWAHSENKSTSLNDLINVVSNLTKFIFDYLNLNT